jgi:predicted DNA-binding ribbon-helix-helix protein
MKSITIHNLDQNLYQELKKHASEKDLSLNKLVKKLLELQLGLKKQSKKADFSSFNQLWNDKDYQEFQETQSEFSSVNQDDWK